MIVSAAVKIYDKRQNKQIIIPVHRHCDAFFLLKEFGYKPLIDYAVIDQGFLDASGNFYNRIDAKKHAQNSGQLSKDTEYSELFSEDLW